MWIYNVGHTRFLEFRNVSANLFLIFTRLWTKVVVSIKGSPNGKFNGYPSISCNRPVHEWLTDRHFIFALGLFVLISFRNLLWVMWWMEESSILQDSLRPRSLCKQIFEQISIDWTSNQCRLQINTHNSTSFVSVASNSSFNGLQYLLLN